MARLKSKPLFQLLLLVLAIVTIVKGSPLSERNGIKAKSITATLNSKTSPSASGQGALLARRMTDEELNALEVVHQGLPTVPQCEIKLTNLPAKIFSDQNANIQQQFCTNWKKDGEKYSMTVEFVDPNESQLRKRTPPIVAAYKDWKVHLSYRPFNNDQECAYDCNGVFQQFAISCSGSSSGQTMYETGTYDVGCGQFWYRIEKGERDPDYTPHTYPKEGSTTICSGENDYKAQKPVRQGFAGSGLGTSGREVTVRKGAEKVCKNGDAKGPKIKKGDPSSFIHEPHYSCLFTPYQYKVYWRDGCELKEGWDWVYANDPLDTRESYDRICADNLVNLWKNCDNGERGGQLWVGCLVYEFRADLEGFDCLTWSKEHASSG